MKVVLPNHLHAKKNWSDFPVDKDQCLKCKKRGHYKRQCPEFLMVLLKNGEDTITFVDESLFLNYVNPLGGLILEQLFMLLIHYRGQV